MLQFETSKLNFKSFTSISNKNEEISYVSRKLYLDKSNLRKILKYKI